MPIATHLAAALLVSAFAVAASAAEPTYPNPLIRQRADPFIVKHTDGYYYFTASVPTYDRIELRRSRTIGGLATAKPVDVWHKHAKGAMGGYIWAPELHYLDGRWYIYFAAGAAEEKFRIRTYALVNDSPNPLEGHWREAGQIKMDWESFTLDATVFDHAGKRYMCWAQMDPKFGPNTSLFIAQMKDPLTLISPQVCISQPTLPWERIGYKVNEGPAFLAHGDKVFITYSASATDANYCMGMLTADASADLVNPASWHKSPEPVLTSKDHPHEFGPGHNSFTVAEDGKTDLIVYHARSYEKIKGDPLFDPNRDTRVRAIAWTADGMPDFRGKNP